MSSNGALDCFFRLIWLLSFAPTGSLELFLSPEPHTASPPPAFVPITKASRHTGKHPSLLMKCSSVLSGWAIVAMRCVGSHGSDLHAGELLDCHSIAEGQTAEGDLYIPGGVIHCLDDPKVRDGTRPGRCWRKYGVAYIVGAVYIIDSTISIGFLLVSYGRCMKTNNACDRSEATLKRFHVCVLIRVSGL